MNWPLMANNITGADLAEVRYFLGQATGEIPRLTNGARVREFEEKFAQYIGTKYACMVNSGASANLVTMAALRHLEAATKVLVPCITWVSDVTSIMQAGMEPVFADVNPRTLGIDWDKCPSAVDAAFVTHCLGFNALPEDWNEEVVLIEDCCEALGAEGDGGSQSHPLGKRLGSYGLASNFSFYYAHHMTTVEGGMICTDDPLFYDTCRMMRGHGLVRESQDEDYKREMAQTFVDLDPQFIFAMPAYNVRPTEIQAVFGLSQMERLNFNVRRRTENLDIFLQLLDASKYRTDYRLEGSSNYALPLVLHEKHPVMMGRVIGELMLNGVEFRRGTAGGGNQLRQPYLQKLYGGRHADYPEAEHIHNFGLYIGNFPDLEPARIDALCRKLNAL